MSCLSADVPLPQKLLSEGAVLLPKPLSREDLRRKMDEMLHTARAVGEG